jgi:hypothetical protein
MPAVLGLIAKLRVKILTYAACLGLTAQPAAADVASLSIPVQAVHVVFGATVDFFIRLPNASTPAFGVNFVLPRDYAANSDVKIIVQMFTTSSGNCDVRFVPLEVVRTRRGAQIAGGIDGISAQRPTLHLRDGRVALAMFTVAPDGTLPNLRPGDGITALLARSSAHTADTCPGEALITAIEIRYQREP